MLSKDFPSPLYSELGIEYQQAYDGPYTNLSYSINGTTVILGYKPGEDERITGFGRPVLAVGKNLHRAAKEIYTAYNDIWYRDYLVNGAIDDFAKFLLEKGYKATPYFTQVIDLFKTEAELHADVRKSYKSLINKGGVALYHDSCFPDDFDRFKKLHYRAAGRKTRSDDTWKVQYTQLLSDEAFIVMSRYAGGFFIYNNQTCYYGVGCSMEGVSTHALIWKAILHAKKLGCKWFEMGEQIFSGGDKLANISKFKRGFGGKTLMRLDLCK